VLKTILRHIQYDVCAKEIKSQKTNSFVLTKNNRGGLTMANIDVVKICQMAEHII
jgi:hypothetical protein